VGNKRRVVAAAVAAAIAYLATGATATEAAGTTTPGPRAAPAVQCPSPSAAAAAPAPPEAAGVGGGSLAVTVPRITFLTKTRAGWLVRTNTETSPDSRDQFVVLAAGGWSSAPQSLEDLILQVCR